MRRGAAEVLRISATILCALWLFPAPVHALAKSDWLGRINEIRLGSHLSPVRNNGLWSAGISKHLRYLALTDGKYRRGKYASAHTENPASPYYTAAGDKEAMRSDITFSGSSNVDAIDDWLTAPFHAIGMLRPGLRQVAFAREPSSREAGLDVIGGLAFPAQPRLVLFPGSGATIDLRGFRAEAPSPLETCEAQHPGADYSRPGLPLIALLTEAPDPGTGAALTAPNGRKVSSRSSNLCVVTEHNFTTSENLYRPEAEAILRRDRAVIVIPRVPLTAGTYTVDIAQPDRQGIAWSFNSRPRRRFQRDGAARRRSTRRAD